MDIKFDMSELIKQFNDIENNLKNLPLLSIATLLQTGIEEVIDNEGNGSWERMSPATVRRHPRRAGGKLLQDTGLLSNIQVSTGEDWAEAGSNAVYAKYHVTGTRKMPKRDILEIDFDKFYKDASELILMDVVR